MSRSAELGRPARVLRHLGGAVLLVVVVACGGAGPVAAPPAPAPANSTATSAPAATAGAPARQAPPVAVSLPGLDTPAPVQLSPVSADGYLQVPDDVQALGWWTGSVPMGAAAGTTLVAGHVDSAEQGLGVFARLAELDAGAGLTVRDGLGVEHAFVVAERVQVGKGALPAELFDTAGPRRLALVTCAGEFDPVARSYADNLVVWAEPR